MFTSAESRPCFALSALWSRSASSGFFFFFGQCETDASLQACAYFGRIVALPRVKQFFSSVNSRPTHRSTRALTSAESWPCPASSGFSLQSTRDRRIAPGVRLLWPNRGPAPRQAVFLFGQLETDASLQACAYSGRIVALPRVKRFFSSVNSRPTHRSRRALTLAESWPCPASSGFFFFGHDNK
jgi:hypothetical protein